MIEYKRLLTLTIRHPLIDVDRWVLLPSSETEQYLLQSRLRMSFSQGRLTIFGVLEEPAKRLRKKPKVRKMCFYLSGLEPYLQRASNLPLYKPGRQALSISVSPKGDGSKQSVKALPLCQCKLDDIATVKKRYRVMPSVPTFGLLHLPRVVSGTTHELEWNISAREVYWAYLITPRASNPQSLSITDGVETFILNEQDNGTLFVSKKPIPLSASGRKGMSLVSDSAAGGKGISPGIPILENLPSPGLDQVQWDAKLKRYRGTVLLDLRHYGATL